MTPVLSSSAPGTLQVDLADDAELARGGHRARFALSLVVATVVHAGLIGAFLFVGVLPYGHGGTMLEAIDVTLVDARALDGTERMPLAEATATYEAAVAASPAASPAERLTASEPEALQPLAPVREQPTPTTVDPEPTERPMVDPKPAATALTVPATTAAATAAPGAATLYATSVVQALARSKPHGVGVRGTVQVRFRITPTGLLDDVRVVSSSGDERLDRMALAAVRSARFGPPPPGLSSSDLSYELPYRFR
jgi:protein TonB